MGHKRTFRSAIVMSALPPKAGICGAKRNVRYGPEANMRRHLVGRGQQLRVKLQAERFGHLEVDHELKLDGRDHREIAWLFALEDSPSIEAGLVKGIGDARVITH